MTLGSPQSPIAAALDSARGLGGLDSVAVRRDGLTPDGRPFVGFARDPDFLLRDRPGNQFASVGTYVHRDLRGCLETFERRGRGAAAWTWRDWILYGAEVPPGSSRWMRNTRGRNYRLAPTEASTQPANRVGKPSRADDEGFPSRAGALFVSGPVALAHRPCGALLPLPSPSAVSLDEALTWRAAGEPCTAS